MAHISDGSSQTYMIGEKFINPDFYYNEESSGDDQGWSVGYDVDTLRFANTSLAPLRDRTGLVGYNRRFGSAHASALNFAFCDGSVRPVSYAIDPLVHEYLGMRNSGQTVEAP